ncbi:MAG: hypothetical protein V4438_00885 [Patescibacteria group bacterium]
MRLDRTFHPNIPLLDFERTMQILVRGCTALSWCIKMNHGEKARIVCLKGDKRIVVDPFTKHELGDETAFTEGGCEILFAYPGPAQ